mmetsp:Transcript_16529/g.34109  ORF Transcript_16529/g.34109 Transcript_16529/m.34109 type:complete len:140 (-) Transcript_16529:5-424(-)
MAFAPLTVLYLGPEGTWSYVAACEYTKTLIKSSTTLQPTTTIHDALSILSSSSPSSKMVAIVPTTNTTSGPVTDTLSNLPLHDNLELISTITIPIVHSLLTSSPSATAASIKVIYSKSQGENVRMRECENVRMCGCETV